MEDGRRSREWLHQASFAAGSMGYEGEGAHKDKYGHGGGLDGFLKPKQNGELRAAEIQSFNQRGGATVKFDTEKLDGYITKILSENEMLKNQNVYYR